MNVQAKVAAEVFAVQAEKDAQAAEAARVAAEAAAASSPAVLLAKAEDEIKTMLESVGEVDEAALSQLSNAVKKMVNASGCYIAEQMGAPSAEEGGPSGKIRYLSASEGQEFVKDAVITENASVTFKAWIMPEAPPAEDAPPAEEGAEGGEAKPAPPPPELPVIIVPDVLRESAMVFHGVPRPGAYVACPLQYGSPLHDGAIPAEHAPANAEDGSLVVPPAVPKARSLAVCADSMGQNREFTEEEVAAVKRVAGYLRAALERTEKAAFEGEYRVMYGPKAEGADAAEAEVAAAVEAANKGE